MNIAPTAMAAATVVTAGFVGIATASIAAADVAADAGNIHTLGSQATLNNGDVVQGWTVSDLKPSPDAIPYPVQGKLWEATATDVAMQGYVVPMVSDLNARSASGQTYRALYQVATPQGVNPAPLAQGEKTTGKVYFDVTGDNPNSVVYIDAENQDVAIWVQPPPSQGRAGTSATAGAAGSAPAAPPPSGSQGTPVPEGTPEAPAAPPATGSQGTPEGTPATPAPEGTPEAPGGTQGGTSEEIPAAPTPAAAQEAPATTPATPAPGGSQGTPEGSSSAPAS